MKDKKETIEQQNSYLDIHAAVERWCAVGKAHLAAFQFCVRLYNDQTTGTMTLREEGTDEPALVIMTHLSELHAVALKEVAQAMAEYHKFELMAADKKLADAVAELSAYYMVAPQGKVSSRPAPVQQSAPSSALRPPPIMADPEQIDRMVADMEATSPDEGGWQEQP